MDLFFWLFCCQIFAVLKFRCIPFLNLMWVEGYCISSLKSAGRFEGLGQHFSTANVVVLALVVFSVTADPL